MSILATIGKKIRTAETKISKAKKQYEMLKDKSKPMTAAAMKAFDYIIPPPKKKPRGAQIYKLPKKTGKKRKKTWSGFVKGKMSRYMKSEGSHGAAMKRLGKEWREYNK